MQTLFYKYPETIGEELEAQIKYAKSIGTIKNNQDLSLEMRKLEKEIFEETRKYRAKDEKQSSHEESVRPATLTELKNIKLDSEISNYFLLFSAFKALNIIKEEFNIIKLLDSYRIKPKKQVDKKRLEEYRDKFFDIESFYFELCNACLGKSELACQKKNCIMLKTKDLLRDKSIDNQIKKLYEFGLPSCFNIMLPQYYGEYYISLETLKKMLIEFKEEKIIDYIAKQEEYYKKEVEKESKINRKEELNAMMLTEKEKIKRLKNNCMKAEDFGELAQSEEKLEYMKRRKERFGKITPMQEKELWLYRTMILYIKLECKNILRYDE